MRRHRFDAFAFVEDLPPQRVLAIYPEARPWVHALHLGADDGDVFFYPFGAVVFHELDRERREEVLARLRSGTPPLVTDVVREDFVVDEEAGAATAMGGGI